jgi:2,3-bisphosphoglycerate-independent phosphoglycerate mutase
LIVTADHGNADCMFEIDQKTGEPALNSTGRRKAKTSHTLNPVPLHVFAPGGRVSLALTGFGSRKPGLANIASTVLSLMGYEAPEGFEPSLIERA